MTRIYTSARLARMHASHGVTEGQRCGHCAQYQATSMYCLLLPTEPHRHGRSASWATNWVACGKWQGKGEQ